MNKTPPAKVLKLIQDEELHAQEEAAAEIEAGGHRSVL